MDPSNVEVGLSPTCPHPYLAHAECTKHALTSGNNAPNSELSLTLELSLYFAYFLALIPFLDCYEC